MILEPILVQIHILPCGSYSIKGPNGTVQLVPEDVVPLVNRNNFVNLVTSPIFLKPVDPVRFRRMIGEMVARVSDPDAGPVLDGRTDPAQAAAGDDWDIDLEDVFEGTERTPLD